MSSFSFDGIKKPYLQIEQGRKRQIYNIKRNLMYLPGKPGAYITSTDNDVKVIELPVFIRGANKYELRKLEEDLAAWLITDEPCELIFDDEPDRIYFAVVDGTLDMEQIKNFGRGTITFICPDPFKYSRMKRANVPYNAPAIINYGGTAPTRPVFTFNILKPVTNIGYIRGNDYMNIGRPATTEETPFNPRTRLIYDDCETTVGWGTASIQPDNGARQGAMTSNGYEFLAESYGTGPAWHGPVIQKSFPTIQDFFVRAYFHVEMKNGKQRGRSEIYLLSESNTLIGKILVVCNDSTGRADIDVQLRKAGKTVFVVNQNKTYQGGFYGYVDLKREGTTFSSEVGIQDKSSQQTIKKEFYHYEDLNGDFQTPLAIVAPAVAKWANNEDPYKSTIRFIRVEEINHEEGVPYIADEGDEVIIDHKRELILINNEMRDDLKDFGADYFSLEKGNNIIVFDPADAFNVRIEWRECFK